MTYKDAAYLATCLNFDFKHKRPSIAMPEKDPNRFFNWHVVIKNSELLLAKHQRSLLPRGN